MEWDKQTHKDLCDELHQTYLAKNKDYGNAFAEQIQEYGQVVALIRIEEKFKRFKQLVLTEEQEVKDEKAFDTLIWLTTVYYLQWNILGIQIHPTRKQPKIKIEKYM